jgi:hypothetical protein
MKISDTAVRKAKPEAKPYKMADGGGMFLLVQPNGGKWWRLKFRFGGKEKLLALGVYPEVTLSEARTKREAARKLLSQGIDPSAEKQEKKRENIAAAANTFEAVAIEWAEVKANTWSAGHKELTMRTLAQDAFPSLGRRPIADISPAELLATLRLIEKRGALEIAGRVLQRCAAVFRYGIATGRCKSNPATELRGALKTPLRSHY